MRGGRLGFRAVGGHRRSNIFHFDSEVLAKNWGLVCPFFVHFWPVLGLFEIGRLIYICTFNFVTPIFPKPYVFPAAEARFPRPVCRHSFSEYFPFRTKLVEKNRRFRMTETARLAPARKIQCFGPFSQMNSSSLPEREEAFGPLLPNGRRKAPLHSPKVGGDYEDFFFGLYRSVAMP